MNHIIYFILITFLAVGCGSSDSQSEQAAQEKSSTSAESTRAASTPSEDASTVEIVLSSNDQMQYDKTALLAKAGQTVKLTLTHTGTMDKSVMGHNFVLLKQGVDLTDFAMKAITAIDNGYIPEGDDIIAHTELIGGGESTTITFTAPAAGNYQYMCSFPGHYGVMKGLFVVE